MVRRRCPEDSDFVPIYWCRSPLKRRSIAGPGIGRKTLTCPSHGRKVLTYALLAPILRPSERFLRTKDSSGDGGRRGFSREPLLEDRARLEIHGLKNDDAKAPSGASYLTKRQKEILDFIAEFQGAHGISPTHREIRDQFGYSSYGTVYKHLKLLQQKGYLHRDWNQKRGLVLQQAPEPAPQNDRELPFLGLIAAGQPIEAISGQESIEVPPHLMGRRVEDHYVLKVVGESMIDEGIHDGDFVVVKQRERADRGEMVVALVGEEATLKRFFPEGPMVRLQPSNPSMKPIMVAASDVRVQGVVVGLMRRF